MTTHDWAVGVDRGHLAEVRADPRRFTPGGWRHLVLEVLAYADDEAGSSRRTGHVLVTRHTDGSIEVCDDGRGTDTRSSDGGRRVRKPVMSTADLRHFANPTPELLPDGHPLRGMSVVAALSQWVVHTNHRREGSWSQRYEHGVPVTGLVPVPATGATGTTVHFLPADPRDCARDELDAGVPARRFRNIVVQHTYGG